jgi:hypothetical protein
MRRRGEGSADASGSLQSRTTNSDNQLSVIGSSSLTYDSNGNLTTDDSGDKLAYDAWNRLISLDISGTPKQYVINGKVKIFTPVTVVYECIDPFHLHIDDFIPMHEPGRFSSYISWQENLYLVSSRSCGGKP